jgi:hypothetical protein
MVNLPKGKVKLLRGILGPSSGTTSSITIQSNNVVRISKESGQKNDSKQSK